jgi:hypothetical protein
MINEQFFFERKRNEPWSISVELKKNSKKNCGTQTILMENDVWCSANAS